MSTRIQRIETDHYASIDCPFCGARVVDAEAMQEGELNYAPCPHTLFIAHDMAFEYRSRAFNAALRLPEDEEIELDGSIDKLTDEVEIPGALKIAAYQPAPSFFGSYVGFAPPEGRES